MFNKQKKLKSKISNLKNDIQKLEKNISNLTRYVEEYEKDLTSDNETDRKIAEELTINYSALITQYNFNLNVAKNMLFNYLTKLK